MNFSDILIILSTSYSLLLTVPFPASNTERQDTFNNRLVEKGNECFVYLELTQFPYKIELFFCFRLNVFI